MLSFVVITLLLSLISGTFIITIPPIINKIIKLIIPLFVLPVNCVTIATKNGPNTAANLNTLLISLLVQALQNMILI